MLAPNLKQRVLARSLGTARVQFGPFGGRADHDLALLSSKFSKCSDPTCELSDRAHTPSNAANVSTKSFQSPREISCSHVPALKRTGHTKKLLQVRVDALPSCATSEPARAASRRARAASARRGSPRYQCSRRPRGRSAAAARTVEMEAPTSAQNARSAAACP